MRSDDALGRAVAVRASGRTQSGRVWAVLALTTLIAVLYWPTTASLLAAWSDTEALTYTHGYLIVAIYAWLLWRTREDLQRAPAQMSFIGAGLLAVASLLWLIGYRAGLQIVHQVLLPLMLGLAVWTSFGATVARRSAFAIAYFYFAVPVWSLGNAILQEITVRAERTLLALTGITSYVDGNFVYVPAGVFEIAGGCSGLHFFVVGLALAALYGEVNRDDVKTRGVLLLLAGGLSLVSNWLRVYIIIVAGHLTNMQHFLVTVDHYYFGWVVFAVAMSVFFLIARRIPVRERPSDRGGMATNEQSARWGVIAAVLAMTIGPAWMRVGNASSAELPRIQQLPTDPGDWRGPSVQQSRWQPAYFAADYEQRGRYERATQSVEAYLVVYAEQRQGKELVGYDNKLIADAETVLNFDRRDAAGLQVNEVQVSDADGEPHLVWFFYHIGERHFVSARAAQLYYGIASLRQAPVAQLLALRSSCVPDCNASREALLGLLESMREVEHSHP